MSKRSIAEKIERYAKKIRKLERKCRNEVEYDTQELVEEPVYDTEPPIFQEDPVMEANPTDELNSQPEPCSPREINISPRNTSGCVPAAAQDISSHGTAVPATVPDATAAPAAAPAVQPAAVAVQDALATTSSTTPMTTPAEKTLDPDLLAALGESTTDAPEFGDPIHETLAKLWLPLLKKGLSKDEREKIQKLYLIPNNCKLLQSPKLNAEISAAVAVVVRGRDKKLVGFQQQLGLGIAAVNRAMDVLLDSDNKKQAVKHLSDSCRMLSDLHYAFTKDRIKLITPSLEKNFLHVIQDTERDTTLFGETLSEKIKASKAIEKQGMQIKKPTNIPKPTHSQATTSRSGQGNWTGPPRYQSNRGGRGGKPKTAQSVRRPYNAPPAKPAAASKPRAGTASHQ